MCRFSLLRLILKMALLLPVLVLLPPVEAQATTVTQYVIQDTFVETRSPTRNWSAERFGAAGFWSYNSGSILFENSEFYVKFAPFTLPTNRRATSVALQLSVFSTWTPAGETYVARVNQDWSEATLVWNNRPSSSGHYGAITFPAVVAGSAAQVQTFTIPLDPSIVNDAGRVPLYGVVLRNTVSNAFGAGICTGNIDSVWGICTLNHRPRLIIGYETAPNPPSGLKASAPANTAGQIALQWTDNSSDETGFYVERSNDNVTFTQVATLPANTRSWTNTGLVSTNRVYYRVRAYRTSTLVSDASNVASAVPGCVAPSAPSQLKATVVSFTGIRLDWKDNSGDEALFIISRSLNGTDWADTGQVSPNITTYTDAVSCYVLYYYRVRSYRTSPATTDSSPSNVVTARTTCAPPLPPSNLTGRALADNRIELTWQDNSSDEAYFILERSLDGNTWSSLSNPAANSTGFADTGLSCYTLYTYRVRAYRNLPEYQSSNTPPYSIRSGDCAPPAAPSNLVVAPDAENQMRLTWNDNSQDESAFVIERQAGTQWLPVATTPPNTTVYVDSGLDCYTGYTYRVQAYRGTPPLNASTYVTGSGSTLECAAPLIPANIRISAPFADSIQITWNDNNPDEDAYLIERSSDGVNGWNEIKQSAPGSTSFTDEAGIQCSTSYFYRMRTYRQTPISYSAYSAVLSVTTDACFILDAVYVMDTVPEKESVKAKVDFYPGQNVSYVLRIRKRIHDSVKVTGRWLVKGSNYERRITPVEQLVSSPVWWIYYTELKPAYAVGNYTLTGFITVNNVQYNIKTSDFRFYQRVPPFIPPDLNPAVTPRVLMQWQAVPYTQQYDVTVKPSGGAALHFPPVTGTQLANIALADGLYTWTVTPLDADGDSGLPASRSFRLDRLPPTPPVPSSPINRLVITQPRPQFVWTASDDVAVYEVNVDSFTPSKRIYRTTGAVNRWTAPDPLLAGLNYWRVRAIDQAGNISAWSAYAVVDIRSSLMLGPVYTVSQPVLTWSGVTWAAEYAVQIAYDRGMTFLVPDASTGSGLLQTAYTLPVELNEGVYYWRIGYRRPAGSWQWTAAVPFVVDLP